MLPTERDPTWEYALLLLAEDFESGPFPYEKVYGVKYPHYLTGQSSSSPIDRHIVSGDSISAKKAPNRGIEVTISGTVTVKPPEDITAKVLQHGTPLEWTDRGVRYRVSPYRFPNGDISTCTEVVECPKGTPAWMRYVAYVGVDDDFEQAVEAALTATPVDVAGD
jgi:hypothetical protein